METTSTDYRGHTIVKHVTHSADGTYFTVVRGGCVDKHYSMPLAMAAIDRWEDDTNTTVEYVGKHGIRYARGNN